MESEKVIRKHVAIIHAYSMMSALQRKIVNVLFYNAFHSRYNGSTDSVAVEYHLPLASLAKDVGFKSHNIQYLKEAIDGLASLTIEWNLLKDRVPSTISFLNLRVLQGSPTFYQDGMFNFSFHKVMLELLHQPSVYGTIDLDVQSKFDSKYGHALYENASRLVHLQKEKVIEIDVFKKLFCVPENKYQSTRELMRNVITPSIEEVNDLASFTIRAENIKANNAIIAFKLYVDSKTVTVKSPKKVLSPEHAAIVDDIQLAFGPVSSHILDSIFKIYGDEYICEKLAYTKKFATKKHTNLFPVAYFISALKNDYQTREKLAAAMAPAKKTQKEANIQAWNRKKEELHLDLYAWQDRMAHFKETNNEEQLKNVLKVVAQCEIDLQAHLDTRASVMELNTDC